MSDRAVSNPVGIVLILGITIASVGVLFGVGGTVVSDTRADAERSQMENSMSGFSSKASLVGLGEASDQRFSLGRASEGDVTVDPDAGKVTLFLNRTGEQKEELNSTSLGAVVYQSGGTEVAYQGGGVWKRQGDFSRMISPPEYHYQLETLTFPIMTVSGDGHSSGNVAGTVQTGSSSNDWFPIRGDEERSNPLGDGTISVEIESRYCTGWETFFQDRSQSILEQTCAEGDPNTVEVDLVVPFEIGSDRPVKARSIDPGTGNSEVPEDWEEDVIAPSISPEVDSQIGNCEGAEENCDDLPSSGTISDGTYWSNGSHAFDGTVTFDTTDGDVTAVVDGNLDLDNDIEIDGDGSVVVYVKGDVDAQPQEFNIDGGADQLAILVHSDADSVDLRGNTEYTGVIYAPRSEIIVNGNTQVTGALVGSTVDINGQPPEFTPSEDLDEYQIVGGDRPLTYLHVSENPVEVSFN